MSSLFFGKHLDPLVASDAREEELTIIIREVGEGVLNEHTPIVCLELLLSDVEEASASDARVVAGAGDFHGYIITCWRDIARGKGGKLGAPKSLPPKRLRAVRAAGPKKNFQEKKVGSGLAPVPFNNMSLPRSRLSFATDRVTG